RRPPAGLRHRAAPRSRAPGGSGEVEAALPLDHVRPPGPSLLRPVNLTTVTDRRLHALLLPPGASAGRLLDALASALAGSGPAILPLDPQLPRERLDGLLTASAPTAGETPAGPARPRPAGPRRGSGGGPAGAGVACASAR